MRNRVFSALFSSFVFLAALFLHVLFFSAPAVSEDNFELIWTAPETTGFDDAAYGDYDGDGDLDIAAAALSAPLTVYKNTAGSFSSVWTAPVSDDTMDVAWGDCNGDGKLDIAAAYYGISSKIYINNGADGFTLYWESPTPDRTKAVAWADYDRDGDLDLLTGNEGQPLKLYRNNGGGSFTLAWSSEETANTLSVDWGDYNNDGYPDILVGNLGETDKNRVYQNNGGGSFVLVWNMNEASSTYDARWGDYDSDGNLDILISNVFSSSRVFRNTGSGDFTANEGLPANDGLSLGGAWGDYNGDGNLDILFAGDNSLFKNTGGGVFATDGTSIDSSNNESAEFGDYDGDGDLDILTTSYNDNFLRIYKNNLNPSNSPPSAPALTAQPDGNAGRITLQWTAPSDDHTPAAALTYALRVGDCSGCNNIVSGAFAPPYGFAGNHTSYNIYLPTPGTYYWSVAAVDSSGFRKSAWSTEDSFTLIDPTNQPIFPLAWSSPGTETVTSIALGDFNGDGDLDVFAGKQGAANIVYEYNPATTGFDTLWTAPETANTTAVAAGDYDGDGLLDLLVGYASSTPHKVFRNTGAGSFELTWTATSTLEVKDDEWLDCDGDLDQLIVDGSEGNSQRMTIFRNDGNNIFQALSPFSYFVNSIVVGDYNGDGYPDLYVTSNKNGINSIYSNIGDCSFNIEWTSSSSDNTLSAAWGDYDNDGDLDVLTGSSGAGVKVLRNDGNNVLNTAFSSGATDTVAYVGWADYDGDGMLDILSAGNGTNRVYHNDGSGYFTQTWKNTSDKPAYTARWADFDGDGDPDIVTGGQDSPLRFFRNSVIAMNNPPAAPSTIHHADVFTGLIVLQWNPATDDHTPSAAISYQLRIGTCSGCNNVLSGAFSPPLTNAGATTGHFINLPTDGTYYWSVSAIDNTGFSKSAWSAEDSFKVKPGFSDSGQALGGTDTNAVFGADIDGDGDIDIIAVTGNYFSPGGTKIWLNNGSGVFTDSGQVLGNSFTVSVFGADVDRDGDIDILEGNVGDPVKIWLNNGSGLFTDSGQALGNYQTSSVFGADVDGDGDIDIIEGNYGEPDRIYLNNGSGVFTDSGQALGNYQTYSVFGADVDGDGDIDIIEGNLGEADKIWLNNGSGVFTDSGQALGNYQTSSVFGADVDGDGDIDIIEGNRGEADKIWLNNGSGVFTDSGQALGNYITYSVFGADVDGDGDIDIIEGNFDKLDRIYLNNGSGVFIDSGITPGNKNTNTVYGADVDGDGDIDIIEGNTGEPSKIWTNNINYTNATPTYPPPTAAQDVAITTATTTITLTWTAGSDVETPTNLLTYDVRIGKTSGGCEVYCGYFPKTGSAPWKGAWRGNAGAATSWRISLATGTYYWAVRTVDTTYKRSAWSAEDSFVVSTMTEPNQDAILPGWNLISFPVTPSSGSLDSALAAAIPTDRFDFGYAGGVYTAGASTTISPGRGYWVYSPNKANPALQGTPNPIIQAVSVSQLSSGWNALGNPYSEAMPWGDGISFNCGEGVKTLSQAVSDGITTGKAYIYLSSIFQPVSPGGTIYPWTGFFVKINRTGCSVTLSGK